MRSYLCLTDQRGGEGGGGIIAVLRPWGQGRKAKASEGENVAAFNCPLIELRRSVCLLHCGSGGGGRAGHVIESSPGQQRGRESTVVRGG